MAVQIALVDYDPAWPERYEIEAAAIRAALGAVALRVDHVGSTSVPGLAAKPIVDIQVSVPAVADLGAYKPQLERLGYGYEPHPGPDGIDDLPFFPKPVTAPRAFHIHVAEAGSWNEERHLRFRDRLRAHPEEAAEYLAVKRELAGRPWPTGQDYADAKDGIIAAIVERSRAETRERVRALRAAHGHVADQEREPGRRPGKPGEI